MRRIALGTLLLALCAPTLAAPIYKWVDAQGTTHFGAQPPENIQAERVRAYAPAPGSVAPSKPDAASIANAQLEQEVKGQIAEQEKQREANCREVRALIVQLENNPRIRFEENGESKRLNEEERQEKIAEAKRQLAENCN